MISEIIKVEVSVISRSRRLRLITLTETLIIPDITKTESNNCFIIHCFEENNDKRIIAAITVYFQTLKNVQLSDKQNFTVFIKQSSAEKLNAFLKKVSLNLYLQVISQFLAGSMKRIEKPFFASLSVNLTLLSVNLTLLSVNLTLLSVNLTLLSVNLTLLSVNLTLLSVNLTLLLKIMHCARNLQIIH